MKEALTLIILAILVGLITEAWGFFTKWLVGDLPYQLEKRQAKAKAYAEQQAALRSYSQFAIKLDDLVNSRYYSKATGELAYLVNDDVRLWFDEEDVLKFVELAVANNYDPELTTLYVNVLDTILIQNDGAVKLHEDFTDICLILDIDQMKTFNYPEIFGEE
jgi:hypothetical protein